MIRIGDYNKLTIVSVGKTGAVASDGQTDIRIPLAQCNDSVLTGAELKLFVYRNAKDQVVATTKKPYGRVGDFASLRVVSVTSAGAFCDWGLEKDLFVPRGQMLGEMREGHYYVLRIITDTVSKRMIGTPRLRPFFKPVSSLELPEGTKVSTLVYENRDSGTLVVIDNQYQGFFPRGEFPNRPRIGTKIEAYVKKFDDQNRVSLSRAPSGKQGWSSLESDFIALLERHDGELPLNDKSDPEKIQEITGLSKKSFKKVVGGLLKKDKLEFTDNGIRLI